MGYYLSKKDHLLVAPLIDILRNSDKDVTFNTSNPSRLSYLLRNAVHIPPYEDVKGQFRFYERGSKVLCIRVDTLNVSVDNVIGNLDISNNEDVDKDELTLFEDYSDPIDQLGIIQHIITTTPVDIIFSDATVSDKEYKRLEKFAAASGYSVERSDKTITFKKNA